MNEIVPNAVFRADCLAVMERMQPELVTVAYIDAPWERKRNKAKTLPTPTESERLQEYLLFLSRVTQQIRRVLTNSGTLFFHADPHLIGHTRLILDQIFGRDNFRRDIVWPHRRTFGSAGLRASHDTIFVYSRSDELIYNPQFKPIRATDIRKMYNQSDKRGAYRLLTLTSRSVGSHNRFEWKGFIPPEGQSWRYAEDRLNQLDEEGRIDYPRSGGLPRRKAYLDESPGVEIGSVWDDITPVYRNDRENLHYGGQRPLALLNRIVRIGSNEGDVVFDPFCGTGTTLVAAQASGRKWIGCDLSSTAFSIVNTRLESQFRFQPGQDYFVGEQHDIEQLPLVTASYTSVITGLEDASQLRFVLGQSLSIEETRHFEFKEVKGPNPVNPIKNLTDEYVVSFLNSEGGRIYWGIRDSDRVVVGVPLSYKQRDEIRRIVTEKLNKIQPSIAPTAYRIVFHQVFDEEDTNTVSDLYVVEVMAPRVSSPDLYWTSKGDVFVRTDGGKKRLNGPEIQQEIIKRLDR